MRGSSVAWVVALCALLPGCLFPAVDDSDGDWFEAGADDADARDAPTETTRPARTTAPPAAPPAPATTAAPTPPPPQTPTPSPSPTATPTTHPAPTATPAPDPTPTAFPTASPTAAPTPDDLDDYLPTTDLPEGVFLMTPEHDWWGVFVDSFGIDANPDDVDPRHVTDDDGPLPPPERVRLAFYDDGTTNGTWSIGFAGLFSTDGDAAANATEVACGDEETTMRALRDGRVLASYVTVAEDPQGQAAVDALAASVAEATGAETLC